VSQFDQNRNGFLADENPKLSEVGQKLSKPIERNQRLNPLCHSYTKKVIYATATKPPPSAPPARWRGGRFVKRPLSGRKLFEIKSLMRFKCRLATYGAFWVARLQGGQPLKNRIRRPSRSEKIFW
jgi:hypothetical protein